METTENAQPVGRKHGGKRAGAGRKAVRMDLGELETLSAMQCTDHPEVFRPAKTFQSTADAA